MTIRFSCPAKYRHVVQGAIALAMHDIATDLRARSAGRPGTLADFVVGEDDGSLIITVADDARETDTVVRDGVDLVPDRAPSAVKPPLRIAS